jgi:hypothetical protein
MPPLTIVQVGGVVNKTVIVAPSTGSGIVNETDPLLIVVIKKVSKVARCVPFNIVGHLKDRKAAVYLCLLLGAPISIADLRTDDCLVSLNPSNKGSCGRVAGYTAIYIISF